MKILILILVAIASIFVIRLIVKAGKNKEKIRDVGLVGNDPDVIDVDLYVSQLEK